jgi:CHRD domain
MLRRALLTAVSVVWVVGYAHAAGQPIELHAALDDKSEVPPHSTGGTGEMKGTYDPATKELKYTVTYEHLTGPAVAAHFHGPADPGQNAGIVVPMKPPLTSPINEQATLDDAQAQQLLAGKWYVNVHTKENPMGEIRGQVTHAGP